MAEDDRSRPATLELSLAAIELLALAATAAEFLDELELEAEEDSDDAELLSCEYEISVSNG